MKMLIDMKASEILKAPSIDDLKGLGSYLEIKKILEKEVDNKLGVKGWSSLFFKIQSLKSIVFADKEIILSSVHKKSLTESKIEISKILGVKIRAKNKDALKKKLEDFINVFCSSVFDPYEHYEKTKMKKFKDSSKLEGIDIELGNTDKSLESILAKYKR